MSIFHGLLVLVLGLSAGLPGQDHDPVAGLRSARKVDDRHLEAVFGPGFDRGQMATKVGFFQIVSDTDKAFLTGVGCVAAEVSGTEPDHPKVPGYAGPTFERTLVALTLPDSVKLATSHRYWLRVASGFMVTQQRAAWITAARPVDPDPGYGIRAVQTVTPTVLQVSLGTGVDVQALARAGAVSILSGDDTRYASGRPAVRWGRRSHLDFYQPSGWPWKPFLRHDVFVELPEAVRQGAAYTVRLAPGVTCGASELKVTIDDRVLISHAIKVNQVGWRPEAPKYVYLGKWMGELNAADFSQIGACEVRDAKTHTAVMTVTPVLRHRADYRLEGGRRIPEADGLGTETRYKVDLSYEDVYELDITRLKTPGSYYIALPGCGRSFAFTIADDVYREPFRQIMSGILHQRCGMELKQPWSDHPRGACHRSNTEWSTAVRGKDAGDIAKLVDFATDGKRHDCPGGHHDAGDWDPRAHLEVAEWLLVLYEINPSAFADRTLAIPEAGNDIPDLLDEARWAFDLWSHLQDADGGVRNGIETAGDPKEGDAAETDSLREFAYAKDAEASLRFAAVMAQASVIWKGLGKTKEAGEFLARARKAWDWALAHGAAQARDQRASAAASLLRATGEAVFAQAFAESSVCAQQTTEPWAYNQHDQYLAGWHYCRAEQAEAALRGRIVTSFETAFSGWVEAAETTAYRHMRSPDAPSTWGTGGLPTWLLMPILTWSISGDPGVRAGVERWVSLTGDFTLGCHPMAQAFSIGLGQRSVVSAWHHLSLENPNGPITGLQSEGPGARVVVGAEVGRGGMGTWAAMCFYPPGPWPALYLYSDHVSPGMNEGIVRNQALTALTYGFCLPGRR